VALTGTERTTYLTKLRDFYNGLKDDGFLIPSVTLIDEGTDSSYLETEEIEGNYIADLFRQGVITEEKARSLSPRVTKQLDEIEEKKKVTIYNTHTGNVVYNPLSNKLTFVDLTQNTDCPEFRTVKKLSQEYIDKMAKQRQLEEEIEQLEVRIKELEEQKLDEEENSEIEELELRIQELETKKSEEGLTKEEQTELDEKRTLVQQKKEEGLTAEEKKELEDKRTLLEQKKGELAAL